MIEAGTGETGAQAADDEDDVMITPAPGVLWSGSLSERRGNGSMGGLELDEVVRRWERGCIVCRARGRG